MKRALVVVATAWVAASLCFSRVFVAQTQKAHPRLVDLASTRCVNCHQDLLQGRGVVHTVAEDCTSCHDVTIAEAGTQITLSEAEPDLCITCHDELESAAALELEAPHAPVADSCTLCHNPHATDQPSLLSAPAAELCTECHEASELNGAHGGQLTKTTDCLRCHLPHGSSSAHMAAGSHLHPPFEDGDCTACHRAPFAESVRLRARGERLCTACHGDVIELGGEDKSLHPALRARRGARGCVSCHDPHMSSNASLLLRSGAELCRSCHESVVSAALADTGHAAAEDCTSCHGAHKAPQSRLLVSAVPGLCHECHDPEDTELAAAHLGADIATLDCTSCHTPHGSGNPKLLARTVHPPLLDGCDTCHTGGAGELEEDGESSLCLMCHDDIGELAQTAPVPHAALELGACTDCHNPHASPQDFLIKLPSGGACLECHDDQAAGEGEVAHGVINLIGCRACHEPHGGENPKLLRETGSALCLACHDPANVAVAEGTSTVRVLDRFELPAETARSMATLRLSSDGQRDHPVAGHRVMGTPTEEELERIDTTFTGELTCLTCHDPHKGATKALLVADAASAMGSCLQCHPK